MTSPSISRNNSFPTGFETFSPTTPKPCLELRAIALSAINPENPTASRSSSPTTPRPSLESRGTVSSPTNPDASPMGFEEMLRHFIDQAKTNTTTENPPKQEDTPPNNNLPNRDASSKKLLSQLASVFILGVGSTLKIIGHPQAPSTKLLLTGSAALAGSFVLTRTPFSKEKWAAAATSIQTHVLSHKVSYVSATCLAAFAIGGSLSTPKKN